MAISEWPEIDYDPTTSSERMLSIEKRSRAHSFIFRRKILLLAKQGSSGMKSNGSTLSLKTKLSRSSFLPEEILTTHELMRLLKIRHRQTIYNLIKEGMPVIIAGRNFRFIQHEVVTFLKRNSQLKMSRNKS